MANIQWHQASMLGFGGDLDLTINAKHTKAVLTDNLNGGQIIMVGEKLKSDAGVLESGFVSKVVFKDGEGEEIFVATGGKYKASDLGEAATNGNSYGVYEALFIGNDKVIGSDGNNTLMGYRGEDEIFGGKGMDIVQGGRGDDELTGGSQQDVFVFENDVVQHDVIHDLDVLGGATDSISIDGDVVQIKAVHNGDDTLLKLDNGSTILLEDVKRADFVDYWNVM